MKTWHKIALGAVAAFAVILGLVFWLTSGITDTADRFFAAARSGDYNAAYAETSSGLQAELSVEELGAFIEQYRLNEVVDTSWSNRSISGNQGELNGTAETEAGETIVLIMGLVSEGDEWKINLIDADTSGLTGSEQSKIPSAEDQADLINRVTTVFVASLADPDLTEFSKLWHDVSDVDVLEGAFGNLRKFEPEMALLKVSDPEFKPVDASNENGHLALEGSYTIDTGVYTFNYIFRPGDNGEPMLIGAEMDWDGRAEG